MGRSATPKAGLSLAVFFVLFLAGCSNLLHIREDDGAFMAVMKGAARVPIFVLTLGASEKWHKREREMEACLGKSRSWLIMKWGLPTAEISDESGGTILVYEYTGSFTTKGHAHTTFIVNTADTEYTPPQTHQTSSRRSFRLDSNGTVVGYAWY